MKKFVDRWIAVFWILFFIGMATTPILAIPLISVFLWLYGQVLIELIKSMAVLLKSSWCNYDAPNKPAAPRNYDQYIQSANWKTLRDHTLNWMEHCCEFCSGRAYQVHHIRYPRKKIYLGSESIKSLATVCNPCHSILHGAPATPNGNSCVFCNQAGVKSLTIIYDHYGGEVRPWVCKKCDLISRGYRRATLGMTQEEYDSWVKDWRETMPVRR